MTLLRTAAAAAALLSFAAAPALAQQSQSDTPTPQASPQAPGAASQNSDLSDAMVHKVGTALRRVSEIHQNYQQRANGAGNQQQLQDLSGQEQKDEIKAITDQGLSVQQYQQAIQMAQANPTLRQRVITAAKESSD